MKNKHSITRWLLAVVLPALFLTACSKDNDAADYLGIPEDSGGDIRFEIGFVPQDDGVMNVRTDGSDVPQTRVATNAKFNCEWEAGDAIGIFAVNTADNNYYVENAKLSYDGTSWICDRELYWEGKTSNFYAYYPYDEAVTNPAAIEFSVKADQSRTTNTVGNTASDFGLSDLMTARAVNVSKGSTVQLQFSHAMAMVQVSISSPKGWWGPSEYTTTTLRGVRTGVTLNLTADTGPAVKLKEDGAAKNVTMYRLEKEGDADYDINYTYRALVPAQEIAKGNKLLLFNHEERQLFTDDALDSDLELVAGRVEMFSRTLPEWAIKTVKIHAGTFKMGSPKTDSGNSGIETQHQVTLTQDFYMSKYEITNIQYVAFLNANNIGSDGKFTFTDKSSNFTYNDVELFDPRKDDIKWSSSESAWVSYKFKFPVVYVNWYGALAYAQWVGGTLPTEAQWEYACRAGTETPWSFGDDESDLGTFAWCSPNSGTMAHEVGTKEPNPWGLHDMHGNVSEWCLDWYGSYPEEPVTDPIAPYKGNNTHIVRGGGFLSRANACRSATRGKGGPLDRGSSFGFRVVFVP